MKIPFIVKVIFIGIIPVWIFSFIVVNYWGDSEIRLPVAKEIEYRTQRGENRLAALAAFRDLQNDTGDFTRHAVFLRQYVPLSRNDKSLIQSSIQPYMNDVYGYYHHLATNALTHLRNIGLYGVAIHDFLLRGETEGTFDSLLKIDDRTLPYVNELRADILDKIRHAGYVTFLDRELEINPQNSTAIAKRMRAYISFGEFNKALTCLQKAETLGVNVPVSERRYVAYNVSWGKWVSSMYYPVLNSTYTLATLGAILILLVWVGFVWLMDLFKDVSVGFKLRCILIPLITSPLVFLFYDYLDFEWSWYARQSMWSEIYATGLFEESIKILPVLLLVCISRKKMNSPYAYFFAAAASAIVFSFEENILYFNSFHSVKIISGRAVFSSVLHMFTTAVTAYGIIMYVFRNKSFWFCVLMFILSVVIHGVFNILLINLLDVTVLFIVLIGAMSWSSMLNNCLNNSPHYTETASENMQYKGAWLIIGLAAILLFEFWVTTWQYGVRAGNEVFGNAFLEEGWLILALTISMLRLELVRNKWDLIDFSGFREISLSGNYEGKRVALVLITANGTLPAGFACYATVNKKMRSTEGEVWFVMHTDSKKIPYALIKFKDQGDNFLDHSAPVLMRQLTDAEITIPFSAKNYPFMGILRMSPVHGDGK